VVHRNREQVRIIGGEWRRRLVSFPPRPGLRPTPDRVRETLFSWLTPVLSGALVLDLCAGSGVLGLEALSRGADQAVLLESDKKAANALKDTVMELSANAIVRHVDARDFLASRKLDRQQYDVVFVDPPYRSDLQQKLCDELCEGHWLARGAHIYVESNRDSGGILPPDSWELLREKRAGQVEYRLFGTV
jgi:16S rRNA (guanine966-N2)-methyltransferase